MCTETVSEFLRALLADNSRGSHNLIRVLDSAPKKYSHTKYKVNNQVSLISDSVFFASSLLC